MPSPLQRVTVHRCTFLVAAFYNLAWSAFSVLHPNWLFEHAGMPAARYPEVFAALAMVVGVYGLLYAEVARDPERGFPIAFVGLLGKVLGPIGWLVLVARGTWPPQTFVMCLFNDVIWWPAFALYLRDAWPGYRRAFRLPGGRTAA